MLGLLGVDARGQAVLTGCRELPHHTRNPFAGLALAEDHFREATALPAVQVDVAPHGAPTEPLPVLRDEVPASEPDQSSDSEADNASGETAADSASDGGSDNAADVPAADSVSGASAADSTLQSDPEEPAADDAEPT